MQIFCDSSFINNPLVSVIVPSYNRKDTIGQTLDSIINQVCDFQFEIIIGDDYSQDGVREILINYQRKYPEIIKLLFFDQNIGLGANWATCVKHCKGNYLANCDNDDYWHNPDKLQLQVNFLQNNPQYGVVHTDYRTHNRITGQIQEVIVSDKVLLEPQFKAIFEGKFQFCNATMLYRKELIDKHVSLDDYMMHQFTLQDWNTWVILAKFTTFCCIPISTATFGIETASITRPTSYEQIILRFHKEKECYKYVCDLFPLELTYDERKYDLYVNSVLLNLAYKRSDFDYARKTANKLVELGDKSIVTRLAWTKLTFFLVIKIKGFLRK